MIDAGDGKRNVDVGSSLLAREEEMKLPAPVSRRVFVDNQCWRDIDMDTEIIGIADVAALNV